MNDDRMEQIVGGLLRTGVFLAAIVVLAGGVWYLAVSGESSPAYHQFRPDVHGLHALSQLPPALALVFAGLLILIATPVARVIFAMIAFALERDRAYVVVTAIVLGILAYSIGTAL